MARSERVAKGEQVSVHTSVRSRPILPLWAAVLVAVAGGAVLDLAYPSVGWWPLAFVGVGLALVTLIGRSAWGALLVGLCFGATFYLIHIMWITRYLGVVPWFALAGIETLFMGLGSIPIALAYRWVPQLSGSRVVAWVGLPALVAGLWTARELFMGSWPYTGFPWARIGMSQSESPLAHVASWVGVSGLTFLMVFFAAALIQCARDRAWRNVRAAIPAAALAVVLLATPAFPTSPAGILTVGSAQGNGPSGYFDERSRNAVLGAQVAASEPLFGQEMDVLLWPEGGIDSDPLSEASTAFTLDAVSRRVGAPLIVNAATTRGDDVYNTSMLWVQGEGAVQIHDKANPVPMGEYVPDRWFFEAIAPDLIGLIQREYTPGSNAPFFDLDGVGIGLAICFDVIYDAVIWEGARDGAQIYMFQTNNADFRGTDENLQQLAFARMRAIETGRSVVNLSTVGTSQVIAPDGSVIDGIPADVAGHMLTDVPLRTGLTPAVVIGETVQRVVGLGSILVLIVVGVSVTAMRRRAKTPAPEGTGVSDE
ncbi:apolipoprotein N-acyltransferase [Microbacterium sp. C7(2022)]|uniref:apolipoprotein N-acyltransferase n=1 Tax=Microbacterium sp. C7(2022) TaxID=2992759 RepID=UPI00237ADDCF|nr:apolipoprotein N-acyltransferase [Microbacterium sp. C7(2022)]MDE0545592.1 apolipoprotein N-acyltransferase [Microbacterium sp. C7(2022)]